MGTPKLCRQCTSSVFDPGVCELSILSHWIQGHPSSTWECHGRSMATGRIDVGFSPRLPLTLLIAKRQSGCYLITVFLFVESLMASPEDYGRVWWPAQRIMGENIWTHQLPCLHSYPTKKINEFSLSCPCMFLSVSLLPSLSSYPSLPPLFLNWL